MCAYMCASVMFACVCIYMCDCDVYMCGYAYICEHAMFSYVGMLISSHVYRGHRRMPGPVLSLSILFP